MKPLFHISDVGKCVAIQTELTKKSSSFTQKNSIDKSNVIWQPLTQFGFLRAITVLPLTKRDFFLLYAFCYVHRTSLCYKKDKNMQFGEFLIILSV